MTQIKPNQMDRFPLKPFALEAEIRKLQISGTISRQPGSLDMGFRVQGDLDRILWPAPETSVKRCDNLWQATCFEFFFGIPGQTAYWEVNLSPSGLWNIYFFTDYRQGMRQENAIDPPVCQTVTGLREMFFSCNLDVREQINDFQSIQVGMACVIENTDKKISYWAMDHFRTVPDFHHRAGFLAELGPLF